VNHERWTNSLDDDNHAIHYKLIRSFKTAFRDFGVSNDRPAPRMEGKGGREKLFLKKEDLGERMCKELVTIVETLVEQEQLLLPSQSAKRIII